MRSVIARATQRLMHAGDSAKVLEAKHIAEAALHYAKVTQAANETHADCVRIITRAEARIADEVDAAQVAGFLAPAHRPQKVSEAPTLSDIGITRQDVSDFRAVRDLGEENIEAVIQKALAEGDAPTKAKILKAAKVTGVFF